MSTHAKPTPIRPAGSSGNQKPVDDGVTNDSLGTIDTADSTGLDETKETGDAKKANKPTHED
jgi:hypothetical protein